MKHFLNVLSILAIVTAPVEAADDPAANFLVKLFVSACIPNMGSPDGIRAWAAQHGLARITGSVALDVFTGPGDDREAWAIPARQGKFALSIWTRTRACAVWARNADPSFVEADYRKIIDGTRRSGLMPRIVQNITTKGPNGRVRALSYEVRAGGAKSGFTFIMLTAEKPGGPFQASLQVARSSAR